MARFTKFLGMAGFTSVCSLEHENPRELDQGMFSDPQKLKDRSRYVNPVYTGYLPQGDILRSELHSTRHI